MEMRIYARDERTGAGEGFHDYGRDHMIDRGIDSENNDVVNKVKLAVLPSVMYHRASVTLT